MRKKVELLLLLLLLAGLVAAGKGLEQYVVSSQVETKKKVVVIDPGHGGSDPGKVGINEALEKDINLQIAKLVKEQLEKKKIEVIMTREEDKTLASDNSTNQKIQDLKGRVELINQTAPALVVSIHQNSYQEESIHGAQVFYYSHSESAEHAANIMQKALLAVDAENNRQAKANDTYYLLKRTEVPTIIVECGFLSNAQEAQKLIDETYQMELAAAITSGIESCLSD